MGALPLELSISMRRWSPCTIALLLIVRDDGSGCNFNTSAFLGDYPMSVWDGSLGSHVVGWSLRDSIEKNLAVSWYVTFMMIGSSLSDAPMNRRAVANLEPLAQAVESQNCGSLHVHMLNLPSPPWGGHLSD